MINTILEWFRNFSLFRVKVAMVAIVVPALTFDLNIEIDWSKKTFKFFNGPLSLEVLIAIIFICSVFIFLDVWNEKIKSEERIANNVLKTIRETGVNNELKESMIKFLKKDF